MKSLHAQLREYIAVRRALGTQLQEPSRTLARFIEFLGSKTWIRREFCDFAQKMAQIVWSSKDFMQQSFKSCNSQMMFLLEEGQIRLAGVSCLPRRMCIKVGQLQQWLKFWR